MVILSFLSSSLAVSDKAFKAYFGEERGRRESDSRRCAGDDGDFIFDLHNDFFITYNPILLYKSSLVKNSFGQFCKNQLK